MLKLRSIGINDYRVLEGRQRIGRLRFADERQPVVWLWSVGGLPMGLLGVFDLCQPVDGAGIFACGVARSEPE